MEAVISDIKRFAVHDGDGIRTTVFFKGCPLSCIWCHNPEGISAKPQIAYYENKCIGCGECVDICPSKAHKLTENEHTFDIDRCLGCGKCEDVCLGKALTFYGKRVTVDMLLPLLLADKQFFLNSGGGVTLSGGECLLQADFCAELLRKLKENSINTAVDTCGYVPTESIDKVLPYTDTFLYDIKAIDEAIHEKCTGKLNELILKNLRHIDKQGKRIEIRYPYVPDFNSSEAENIAVFLSGLKNISAIRVLPYHNYAASKYAALKMCNMLPATLPTQDEIRQVQNIMRRYGIPVKE